MIVPSMTRREIAAHLLSEVCNNSGRIAAKIRSVAKQMSKAEKKIHVCKQRVGSNVLLTIYIYGIDKKGVDYAIGSWYHSDKGLCWATVGQSTLYLIALTFFNDMQKDIC